MMPGWEIAENVMVYLVSLNHNKLKLAKALVCLTYPRIFKWRMSPSGRYIPSTHVVMYVQNSDVEYTFGIDQTSFARNTVSKTELFLL